jgi:pyruvate kinase
VPYAAREVAGSLKPGTRILVDDGEVELPARKVTVGVDLGCTDPARRRLEPLLRLKLLGERVNLPA